MAMYILRRKTFTKYDETDNLKRLKDSDILAEKKRRTTNYGSIAGSAIVGSGLGAAAGGALGKFGKVAGLGGRRGAALGALGGAAIGAGASYLAGRKKARENREYNNRLRYAQRQALRRERKDWVTNMTQRDGYTY